MRKDVLKVKACRDKKIMRKIVYYGWIYVWGSRSITEAEGGRRNV